MTVFLKDEITPVQRQRIRGAIEGLDVVEGVKYISKDDALEEFRDLYRDQPALLENVDADALIAMFQFSVKDFGAGVREVLDAVEGLPGVEETAPDRDQLEHLG